MRRFHCDSEKKVQTDAQPAVGMNVEACQHRLYSSRVAVSDHNDVAFTREAMHNRALCTALLTVTAAGSTHTTNRERSPLNIPQQLLAKVHVIEGLVDLSVVGGDLRAITQGRGRAAGNAGRVGDGRRRRRGSLGGGRASAVTAHQTQSATRHTRRTPFAGDDHNDVGTG